MAETNAAVTAARASVSAQTPMNPPMQLSAAATAFSLEGIGASISPGRSGGGGEGSSIEDRAGARVWQQRQYATSLDQQQQQQRHQQQQQWFARLEDDGRQQRQQNRQQQQQQIAQPIGVHARGEFVAAVAAARAAAAGRRPEVDDADARGGERDALDSDGGGLVHGGHSVPGAHMQALSRASYMTALPPEPPASETGGVAAVGSAGGGVAAPVTPSAIRSRTSGHGSGGDDGGGSGRIAGNQSNLAAALPAFRHWESQRAGSRNQVGRELPWQGRHFPSPTGVFHADS